MKSEPSRLRGRHAPWNNPKLCPSCARVGDVIVGGRRYCASCARSMRLFLSSLPTLELAPERDVNPLEIKI